MQSLGEINLEISFQCPHNFVLHGDFIKILKDSNVSIVPKILIG